MIKPQKITLFMHSNAYQNSRIVPYFIKDKGIYKLDTKEFKKLSKDNQDFLIKLFSEQFEVVSEEWEIKKVEIADKNTNIKCALCNHSHLKIIATIENKINKSQLKVGSTCIESYNRITTTDGKTTKESKHNFIRAKNIEHIEKNTESFYQDYLMLKQNLTNTYIIHDSIRVHMMRSVRRIDTLLKNKNINTQDIIIAIQNLKNSKLKFEEWIKFSENDTFGINKDIQNWVSLYGSESLINQLSKYGKITKKHLLRLEKLTLSKK